MVYKNILIVDDDEVSNFVTQRTITINLKANVDTVSNGQEAIEYLTGSEPDLILLDLNMPLMNGVEFLEYLKVRNVHLHAHIIILTTSNRPDDQKIVEEYEIVKGYIEKPLDIETLKHLLSLQ